MYVASSDNGHSWRGSQQQHKKSITLTKCLNFSTVWNSNGTNQTSDPTAQLSSYNPRQTCRFSHRSSPTYSSESRPPQSSIANPDVNSLANSVFTFSTVNSSVTYFLLWDQTFEQVFATRPGKCLAISLRSIPTLKCTLPPGKTLCLQIAKQLKFILRPSLSRTGTHELYR